jgi:hypothetical protein
MAEEEKSSESQPLFPEIDPAGMVADDPEQNSATKALVPFDPLQRYLAEIRRFSLLSREGHRLAVSIKNLATSRPGTSWLPLISAWL